MNVIRMQVQSGQTLRHAGAWYGPGWVLEMTAEEAAAAKAAGHCADAPAPKPKRQAPEKPAGDALTAAIMAAFEGLPEDALGKDRVPNVKPLEQALGYSITAAERDAAWAAYQAAQGAQ